MFLLIETLYPLLDFSILEFMCLNFNFMIATIFDSSNKVVACLSNDSFNYLIVSLSLCCSYTLVLSAMIGA